MKEYVERLRQAVIDYDMEGIGALAEEALAKGLDPLVGIEEGLAVGIREVGRRFGAGELFLPELVMAAEAMRAGVAVFQPRIPEGAGRTVHRVLLATVQDDIHEIGKNLVATMLTANGYEVVDIGVNKPVEEILKEAERIGAEVIGVSALMTTTMPRMKELIDAAVLRGARHGKRYIVGGAPVTEQYSKDIRADGTAGDAPGAVQLVNRLVGDG